MPSEYYAAISNNATEVVTALADNVTEASTALVDVVTASTDAVAVDYSNRFPWDEHQKQMILGSFFWGYVLTELPGGRLAELVGGHRVFGHSMFWASVITLVTPVTAHMGYVPMVILRALLGFMLGGKLNQIKPKFIIFILIMLI